MVSASAFLGTSWIIICGAYSFNGVSCRARGHKEACVLERVLHVAPAGVKKGTISRNIWALRFCEAYSQRRFLSSARSRRSVCAQRVLDVAPAGVINGPTSRNIAVEDDAWPRASPLYIHIAAFLTRDRPCMGQGGKSMQSLSASSRSLCTGFKAFDLCDTVRICT